MEDINILKAETASGRKYVFDAIINKIYEIDSQEDLNSISQQSFGRKTGVRKLYKNEEELKESIINNAKTLIIEITEKCNLRCTYCVFDEDFSSERIHSNISANINDIKQAIYNFYQRTNKKEAYIVFYGGEPLLELETIKELVKYSNKISNNFKYSTTTNGTQITHEALNFLIKNDFKLTISIDGPQEIHDKYRIKINNKGSWEQVLSNIEKIKSKFPKFFKENVNFNCVIANKNDINSISNYFKQNKLFQTADIRYSAEISKSNEINNAVSEKSKKFFKEIKNFDEINTTLESDYLGNLIKKFRYREEDELAKNGKKYCIPFSNRTYVRSNGKIQFCERIQDNSIQEKNSSSKDLAEHSIEIYNEFSLFKDSECIKCFAYNFCEMCPASFMHNGKLNKELSKIKCDLFRKDVKNAFIYYLNIMENNKV